jgi:cell wall-associated NlpC family hydrolase
MNLIRNTLLVVAMVQLLGFSYIKIFHEKSKTQTLSTVKKIPKHKHLTLNNNYLDSIILSTIDDVLTASKEKKIVHKKALKKSPITKISKTTKKIFIKKKLLKKIYSINTKVEAYAKEFLGYKYVWGATGPNTFDCSGFTQKVYRDSTGITIPRVSREQAKVGLYVSYNELKRGDMVFFDTSKEHKGVVNHVGIYLEKGEFIHASSGGKKVMITNFNKRRFYKNRFLWGRRVIDENHNLAFAKKRERREKS